MKGFWISSTCAAPDRCPRSTRLGTPLVAAPVPSATHGAGL